jgi:hypothetical protein
MKNSWPSASSPPQADAPPTSFRVIPIHEPTIPVFQYFRWIEASMRTETVETIFLRGIERLFQRSQSEAEEW